MAGPIQPSEHDRCTRRRATAFRQRIANRLKTGESDGMRTQMIQAVRWLSVGVLVLAGATWAEAQSSVLSGTYLGGASNAYPAGDFSAQLSAASGNAPNSCDPGWGCGGSPFRTGPGSCDTWKVGPRWEGHVDGLVLFRDEIDIASLAGAADAGGVALPINADTLTSNFDHGAGARLTMVGQYPACQGYEMVVSYMGVFGWDAGAFNADVPPAGPIATQPDLLTQRSLSYHSSLHSLEINGQTTGNDRLKLFGGMRYVRLAEDIDDIYDEYSPTPSLSGVAEADLELTDVFRNVTVNNNLIGFQGGVRSDLIGFGDRFFITGFANSGIYCNLIRRSSNFRQVDTFVRVDDPLTTDNEAISVTASTNGGYKSDRAEVAFVSEASLSAAYMVNACTTARMGYQVFYIDGVELGDEAFLGTGPTSDNMLLHGWFAGIEYKR